jgi:YD repeat-containing protein
MAKYVILNGVRTRYEDDGSQTVQDVQLTQAFDYDAAGNVTYHGRALPGNSKAAPAWQVKKFTYDAASNLTDVQYANGSLDYTSVWDDRAGLSYS